MESRNDSADEIEILIAGMQAIAIGKGLGYTRIGGANGMKLSQAAFAVMIKFSGLLQDLEGLLDELVIASVTLPSEEENKG